MASSSPPTVRAPLGTRSVEHAWREAFRQDVRALGRRRLIVAGTAFLVLHSIAFAVLDPPGATETERTVRAAVIPATLAVLLVAWRDRSGRLVRPLTLVLIAGLASYIVWTNGVLERPADNTSLLLLLMGSGLLLPIRPGDMIVASVLSLGAFVGGCIVGIAETPGAEVVVAASFYLFAAGLVASLGSALSWSLRMREHRARNDAERLLHNTLPTPIVEQLKRHPGTLAEGHEEVTVLFADLVGFTPLSEALPPDRLLELLDRWFTRIDALCEQHGCEKIKTIGDAYMAAAGVPVRHADHAAAVASLALDLRDTVEALEPVEGHRLTVRIGINTGPVVAGVIGTSKFTYDLWGDAVNVAARMESQGRPGLIQVTEETQRRLAGRFELEALGTVEVKGKGAMSTYALVGRRNDAP